MEHKIPKLEDYIISEGFSNPFDNKDGDKKPKSIVDSNQLKLRSETFNMSRVEFSKRDHGGYTITSKTQFAREEIIEICPIILVGVEAKAIPRLKDFIFEINKTNNMYGVVLGYGSLYRHSQTPNCRFAYNSSNKQMYFIALRPIQMGEELTIDYGKEYWAERTNFNITPEVNTPILQSPVAQVTESGTSPGTDEGTNTNFVKVINTPVANSNQVQTAHVIQGLGQS